MTIKTDFYIKSNDRRTYVSALYIFIIIPYIPWFLNWNNNTQLSYEEAARESSGTKTWKEDNNDDDGDNVNWKLRGVRVK